ncbi:transglutaminase family protein [Cereibacter sphaeroides]|nr:transglutaminase family protein [Cereibacter sphaeroides]
MRLLIGSRQYYQFPHETPLIAMLRIHSSRVDDLELPDIVRPSPDVPIHQYVDGFGNSCDRMIAPAGEFVLTTWTICSDTGEPDLIHPDAKEIQVWDLPDSTLLYLLGSRYCETDLLSAFSWKVFGGVSPGWGRVQAVCDYVHHRVTFDYAAADATRTATQTLAEGKGVCRDFTHLAIAICRCLNIPARYCTGYLSDIGEPEPYPPGDFAAWMEVFLDGAWWVFDPRNNTRRRGRILIARGRDAGDVPLTHTFGEHKLTGFKVFADLLT